MRNRYDLIVIGAGSGGLLAAQLAAAGGTKVALVERNRLGGDCLWTGCVPSKTLIASAKVAHSMATAHDYGIAAVDPRVDLALVWKRIKEVQATVAEHDDNPARYREMGVDVRFGEARIAGRRAVVVAGETLRARRILIATGSRPSTPPIPGLRDLGHLTSESIFELDRPPSSLVMIGAGPISIELAQALNRLGIKVTVLEVADAVLTREEPALAGRLVATLRAEGVEIHTGVTTEQVRRVQRRVVVDTKIGGVVRQFSAEAIFVGAGRTPNVDGLGLDQVGVEVGPRGIVVDRHMRTSVRSIYAVGDIAGRYLFTHSAAHEATIAVRHMLYPFSPKVDDLVPWCTFTDPELAHVGMTEAEAKAAFGDEVDTYRIGLDQIDRTRADGHTDGEIIVVTRKRRVVGAHVLAPAGGEIIHELGLAIQNGTTIGQLGALIHAYPTLSSGIGQLALEGGLQSSRKYRWLSRLWSKRP